MSEDVTCARCSERRRCEQVCFVCHALLCDDCWEWNGNCGHPEADALNARGRRDAKPEKAP